MKIDSTYFSKETGLYDTSKRTNISKLPVPSHILNKFDTARMTLEDITGTLEAKFTLFKTKKGIELHGMPQNKTYKNIRFDSQNITHINWFDIDVEKKNTIKKMITQASDNWGSNSRGTYIYEETINDNLQQLVDKLSTRIKNIEAVWFYGKLELEQCKYPLLGKRTIRIVLTVRAIREDCITSLTLAMLNMTSDEFNKATEKIRKERIIAEEKRQARIAKEDAKRDALVSELRSKIEDAKPFKDVSQWGITVVLKYNNPLYRLFYITEPNGEQMRCKTADFKKLPTAEELKEVQTGDRKVRWAEIEAMDCKEYEVEELSTSEEIL